MKRAGFWGCVMVLGLAACSDETTTVPEPEGPVLLEPPPEGQGHQFRMVTSIEAGSEVEHCQFFKAPAEGMIVNRDEIKFSEGSHHVLLYLTPYEDIPSENVRGEAVDTSAVFDCSEGPTFSWEVSNLVGGSQNASGDPTIFFPPDVGMRVPPNAVLLMNAHYVNPQPEPLEPEVRINLWTIAEQDLKTEGGVLFFYNPFIRVGAMGAGSAEMTCPIPEAIQIGAAQSHMHRRGVGYGAELLAPDASPETIYENDAWEGVPVKKWQAGLAVPAGSSIRYSCEYENAEDRTVYQGPKTTDEMCMFIASYWPARTDVSLCASDPEEPYQSQSLAGEWRGEGAATCGDTLLCIQQIPQEGDLYEFLRGLTDCIYDSAPEEGPWVSNGVRCLLTSAEPISDCQAEIQACLEH